MNKVTNLFSSLSLTTRGSTQHQSPYTWPSSFLSHLHSSYPLQQLVSPPHLFKPVLLVPCTWTPPLIIPTMPFSLHHVPFIPIKPIPPTFAWPHKPLQTFLPFHHSYSIIPITMPTSSYPPYSPLTVGLTLTYSMRMAILIFPHPHHRSLPIPPILTHRTYSSHIHNYFFLILYHTPQVSTTTWSHSSRFDTTYCN